jgi:signal transduction histidine kinase
VSTTVPQPHDTVDARMRWVPPVAWGTFVLGIVLVLAALPLAIACNRVIKDFLSPVGFAFATVGAIWLATGALIVSRQPKNWAGCIFIFVGFSVCFSLFISSYAVYGLRIDPDSLPLIGIAAWLNEYVFLAIAFVPLLFLLFPDGHVPSRGWRWAVVGLLGGMVLAFLAFVVRPEPVNNLQGFEIEYQNPFGIEALGEAPGVVIGIGTVAAIISSVACVLGLRSRFKRSSGEERQQMRWLVFVGSVASTLLTVSLTFSFVAAPLRLPQTGDWPIFPTLLGLTAATVAFGVPTAFLVAIYRYRLYDLDLVIRKAVIVGVMTVFIAVVYGAIVGGIGVLVGDRGGPALAFLGAAVLAIAFQPARDRARRLADHIVYGERATPYEVLTEFSERVGETYAADDVLTRMAAVLGEGTGAASATVWLRIGKSFRPEATWPADVPPPVALPEDAVEVRHQGEQLGALSVAMPASDPMDPVKQQLVNDLATQAGLMLRNVRLIEELRASRQRLIAAQDEERRKLERNIHDGVQQQLVALSVQLRLAEQLSERDPSRVREMLSSLQGRTNETLEDLRDLARGIYPPLLADKGLATALESQARKAAIPVTLDAEGLGRYDRAIESAVYFCTLEALNNIAKYAEANAAVVTLARSDGHLRFTVTDDGAGFDTTMTSYGTGLQGMADRLDAIGGTIEVHSEPGRGTTIAGTVPVV